MKHLIIFLDYSKSRLENAVYQIFSSEALYKRKAALLFLNKALDERELLYEVSSLRSKQNTEEDITFHVIADFSIQEEGSRITNTLQLIRKSFIPEFKRLYPIFIYGQMPNLSKIDDDEKKIIWRNLVVINKAVSDHIDCRLLSTVFLFNDKTQKSLAEFIYHLCHSDISHEQLSSRLPAKQTLLFEDEVEKLNSSSVDFPNIFGGFNTIGMSYPEVETLSFLHNYFLKCVFKLSYSNDGADNLELCSKIADAILAKIPLQTSTLCLQEETFINLNIDEDIKWQTVEAFWKENIQQQSLGLSNYPKDDWLHIIRQRADSLYFGRFREIGTDYFFKMESKKTEQYSNALYNILAQSFFDNASSYSLSPQDLKAIIQDIINALQNKLSEIQALKSNSLKQVFEIESELQGITDKWNGLNIFTRMLGKNTQILNNFNDTLTRLYIEKSLAPGCEFAEKLLDELIPKVDKLLEKCDEYQAVIDKAVLAIDKLVESTNPSALFGIFGENDLLQTLQVIENDKENLADVYKHLLSILINGNVVDADELIAKLHTDIAESITKYIYKRIEDCTIPPIIGMSIIDRIECQTSNIGGFKYFLENLKRQIPISLNIKSTCKSSNKYILISPPFSDSCRYGDYCKSEDISHLQLINVRYGLSIQDLGGFAGQKMYVEPSIF